MTTKNVKHITGKGQELNYIRLFADDGKVLTNDGGRTFWSCIDVQSADGWVEIEMPPDPGEEATAEDYEAALNRLGVNT